MGKSGQKHTEETKRKISESNKGRKHSEDARKHFSEIRKGKAIPWFSQSQTGVKHPPDCEHCQRVRESNAKRALPDDVRIARRKEAGRAATFKTIYGITIADYDRMMADQNGVCAICFQPCGTGKRLAIDHDHANGAIRGLLCRKCNLGLGHFDITSLRVALSYLEKSLC